METTEPDEKDNSLADPVFSEPPVPTVTDSDSGEGICETAERPSEPFIIQNTAYGPVSIDENVRRSGLAWSAGIVFFSSIAFMLFLGWIADVLLGSSPWGLVGGIVLGSIIGFIQFFRISSQIFEKSGPRSSPKTLFKDNDES